MSSSNYYQICRPMSCRVSPGIPKDTYEALERIGIDLLNVTHLLKSVTVKSLKETIHGIGFYNKKGGIEFYSPFYANNVTTLKKRGTIYIPYKVDRKSENCLVFFDFMDYLAYRTMTRYEQSNLPWKCDCIIINHVSSFADALLDCELYKRVYSLLPSTTIGDCMKLTLRQCLNNMVDMCYLYQPHATVYDCLKAHKISNKKSLPLSSNSGNYLKQTFTM